MNFRLTDLVYRGLLAGAVLGLAESAETITEGFLSAYAVGTHLLFVACCVAITAGAGALLGVCVKGVWQVIPARIRDDIPAHIAWSVFIAGQLAWVVFLYGFKLLPMWGIGILPAGGLFNPVLPGTVGLIVAPIVVFAVAAVGLYRRCYGKWHRIGLTAVTTVLLYWQVSYGLYAMSRISPADKLHTLSLVMLLGLVMLLVPSEDHAEANSERPGYRSVLVVAALLLAPVTQHVLGAYGSHTLRLLMHGRTALAYRVLEVIPATYPTDPMQAVSTADCEAPMTGSEEQPQVDKARKHDSPKEVRGVVFIMIDAFRGDLIGARREAPDGSAVELTPNLNELAGRSIWFENTYSTAAVTRLSAASMVTGRYSDVSDIRRQEDPVPTIASDLSQAGVQTTAIPGHPILKKAFGEFDVIDETVTSLGDHRFARTSDTTVERVLQHLEHHDEDEKFFVFAHFYDPHWYYVPNDRFYFGLTEHDRYHAEVAYTDYWIGQLVDQIRAGPHGDDVAIVVIGDHGEEFWDHKYIQHVVRLYDESIRVPWIVDVPSTDRARRVTEPVSTVDVAPTVLQLFGVRPRARTDGIGVYDDALAEDVPRRLMFSVAPDKHAVIDGQDKLIVNTDTGILELYDLEEDPGEHRNLADEESGRLEQMMCAYSRNTESQAFAFEF